MKKKIFLNLVMGISLIATPALLLASCSAQASDVKLPITKKVTPDLVLAVELKVSPITLKTVQKLFDNVDVTSFENVTATLKNESVVTGTPNNVVLTAKDGFVFEDGTENGAKTLESSEFKPSVSILPITKKVTTDLVSAEELQVSPISITTLQKLFDNVDVTSFENVTATLKNGSAVIGTPNNVVLTAKDGFVFEDGAKTLESSEFNPFSKLPITKKATPDLVWAEELQVSPITLTTLQKLFNIDADSFKNVTTTLKNESVVTGTPNNVVLTAKDGFVFEDGTENGAKTLASVNFNVIA